MRLALRCAATAAVVCFCACVGGTETGNPSVPIGIALGIRSSDPSVIAISSGTTGTVVKEAWVAFGEPVFIEAGGCGTLEDMGEPGPTRAVTDLADPDVSIDLEVAPESYCGMWVPIQGQTPAGDLPDGAPAELANHSIVLRGERGDGTPFVLMHAEQDELEVSAADGSFDVSVLGPALVLSFDVADWMKEIDLDAVTPDADGQIVIDPTHNPALHEAFDANLECSLELYLDENENGRLDEKTDTLVGHCGLE